MSDWNPKKEWQNLLSETRIRTESEHLNELFGFGKKKKEENKDDESSSKPATKKVETWEDLQGLLELILQEDETKKAIEASSEAGGKMVRAVVGAVPVVGNVWQALGGLKDVHGLVGKLRKTDQEKADQNPIMSALQIDPGYSEILDPKLELEFIKWFSKWVAGKSGKIDESEEDINSILEKWLKQRGKYDETVTDAESTAQFTDIPVPKAKDWWDKLKQGAKTFGDNVL